MRARPGRIGIASAALAAIMLGSIHPSGAAARPFIVDPAGDANGLNDQGEAAGATVFRTGAGTSSPAQAAELDILSLTMSTQLNKKRRPTSVTMLLALGADPASDPAPHQYLLYFDTTRCAGNKIRWEFTPSHPGAESLWTTEKTFYPGDTCTERLGDQVAVPLPYSEASGTKLIIRVPFTSLARTKAASTKISNMRIESRMRFRQSYSYPIADVAFEPGKVYSSPK